MSYIDLLAILGIEDAHPGGFELTKYILTFLPLYQNSKVLEIGCGTGKTAIYLNNNYSCNITVVEVNDKMIQLAKKNFENMNVPIQLIKANAEKLPFATSKFEIILSESATAFTNVKLSLKEYVRVLKKNGVFVCIEMTSEEKLNQSEQIEIMGVYGVKQVLTEFEWIDELKRSGFNRIQLMGGNAITYTKHSQIPPNKFHNLSNEFQKKFLEHQKIVFKYRNILGYRIFYCMK